MRGVRGRTARAAHILKPLCDQFWDAEARPKAGRQRAAFCVCGMAQRPGQLGRFLYLELGPFSVPGRYANHAHHSYFAAHLSGTESGPGSWAAGAKEGAWCERVLATIPNRNAIAAQQAGPLFVPGSWAVFCTWKVGRGQTGWVVCGPVSCETKLPATQESWNAPGAASWSDFRPKGVKGVGRARPRESTFSGLIGDYSLCKTKRSLYRAQNLVGAWIVARGCSSNEQQLHREAEARAWDRAARCISNLGRTALQATVPSRVRDTELSTPAATLRGVGPVRKYVRKTHARNGPLLVGDGSSCRVGGPCDFCETAIAARCAGEGRNRHYNHRPSVSGYACFVSDAALIIFI